MTNKNDDAVLHPAHYTFGRFECIDVIEELVAGLPGKQAFLLGNTIKYLWRFQHKNGLEDLKKARWYLTRLIRHYETCDGLNIAVFEVFPGIIQQPVFNRATAKAAAGYIGETGDFFDAATGKRTRGMLIKIADDSPAPFIGRVCFNPSDHDSVPRYGSMPYKFFSPLPKTGNDEQEQEKEQEKPEA